MSLPRLRYNIAALGGLQVANYLIPLVTLPFVSRVLGVDNFGKIAFVQIVSAYLMLIIDYGFSWSTARRISANRDNIKLVSALFVSSWAAQWLLVLICGASLSIAVVSIPTLRQNAALYAAGFLFVIGNALIPLWLLQGLEKMREVAAIQIAAKIITTILILGLLRSPEDGGLLLLITGSGQILAGIACIVWIKKNNIIIWIKPRKSEIQIAFQEGFAIFGSKLSISLYTTLIPLTLGMVAGNVALANFVMADKIRQAAQSMMSPISQALFPRMSHLFEHDADTARELLSRSLMATLVITVPLAIILLLGADYFVMLLGGAEYAQAATLLRLLAFVPLMISLSNLYGVQVLLAKGMTRTINITAFTVGITAACCIYPMVMYLQAKGAAITILIAEVIVATVYYFAVNNSHLLKSKV